MVRGKIANLTGKTLGYLKVLNKTGNKTEHGSLLWNCKCVCGNEIVTSSNNLRNKNNPKTNCGCKKIIHFKDLTGKKFGKLTVLEKAEGKTKMGNYRWLCECDCGNKKVISGGDLTKSSRKGTMTCGCYFVDSRSRYVGKRYGKLLVLEVIKCPKSDIFMCNVICDCGTKKLVTRSGLTSGSTKSCGCWKASGDWNHAYKTATREEYSVLHVYNRYKNSAEINKREFSLTKNQFIVISTEPCHYCDRIDTNYYGTFKYNGIDRKDSSKGYFIENCVSCCFQCNKMKMDLDKNEFEEHLTRIFLNRTQNKQREMKSKKLLQELIDNGDLKPETHEDLVEILELKAKDKGLIPWDFKSKGVIND